MTERTDRLTDEALAQFLRSRTADPGLTLLDDIVRAVEATPQQRPWLALPPMVLPRRTVLILATALMLAALGAIGLGTRFLQPDPLVITFGGTWISTSDADGGTQTMDVVVSADASVEITVRDTVATVCSFAPSTMTGTGTIEDGERIFVAEPVYTCDDGSQPATASGPPLEERLRDWTMTLDPGTGTLTDSVGGIWYREGAPVPTPHPSSAPPAVEPMWPQTSIDAAREAQELADAGDPNYTWQLAPELIGGERPWDAEILDRFIREELGWEDFSFFDGYAYGDGGGLYTELVFFRCAPGTTNSLYPDDPEGARCAPTVDEFRYETVRLTIEQPLVRGPRGIWVVTERTILEPQTATTLYEYLSPDFTGRAVEQLAPPTDWELDNLLRAFLEARVAGEGADEYVLREPEGSSSEDQEVPLLYATSDGSAYERFEFERLHGPAWPTGWTEFRTRLFSADGTVVEQIFAAVRLSTGEELGLVYGYSMSDGFPSTENGEPVPVLYRFLDGAMTFSAALPWSTGAATSPTLSDLSYGNPGANERFEVVADPRPGGGGCEPGLQQADAAALAEAIQADPDLEVTAPVTVSLGGIDALQMDVVAAPGASVCADAGSGGPLVITDGTTSGWVPGSLPPDGRMRLFLLDLPGETPRTVAVAVSAPEREFERVLETATPILDSIKFTAP